MTSPPPSPRYRLAVASRIVAAVGGGYAVAALLSVLLALALPMARAERVIAGALVAVAVLPVVAIACFWTRGAAGAWTVVIGASLALAGLAWLAGGGA